MSRINYAQEELTSYSTYRDFIKRFMSDDEYLQSEELLFEFLDYNFKRNNDV